MMSLPTAVPKVGAMRKMLQYVYMNGRAGIAAHCDDDLSHAHGRRGRHPIFCVKIGGVEDVRFEAWLQRTAQCQVGEAGGAMGSMGDRARRSPQFVARGRWTSYGSRGTWG
jgi:hypothetical protein